MYQRRFSYHFWYAEYTMELLQGRPLFFREQDPLEGDDVELLQSELRKLGYDIPLEETAFADYTWRAVRAFQEKHYPELPTSGVVDRKTAGYINEAVEALEPEPEPEPESSKQAATRSILQAVYTPRQPEPEESPSSAPRALEKATFVAQLVPSQEELNQLAEQYRGEISNGGAGASAAEKALSAVEVILATISDTGRVDVLRSGKQFAGLEVDTLVRVASDLIGSRRTMVEATSEAHKTILEQFTKTVSLEKAVLPAPEVSVKTLVEWAIENNIEKQYAIKTLALGESLSLRLQDIEPSAYKAAVTYGLTWQNWHIDGFEESMNVEPVGYLHLERMSFTPAGIERGELVYSVPLSPGEEVNIRHREWSHTSEEFERIVTDYLEEFSEEGVTEKSELAQSVDSQTQHSTAFNTGVTASGSYGPVSITATVGYNSSDSSSKSEQLSRNRSTDATHKASSRSKKEHKFSFRVASAAETEDETVQRIKNPFPDRATRVDYYQLIRKWQVNLYRYGIRLTWDIAVPEPGSALLSKMQEINRIRTKLEEEFRFPLALEATPEGYTILDDENYAIEAAKYGAMIGEDPPIREYVKTVSKLCEPEEQDKYISEFFTLDVADISDDYFVDAVVALHPSQAFETTATLYIYLGEEVLYEFWIRDNEIQVDRSRYPDFENPYTGWRGEAKTLQFLVKTYQIKRSFIQLHVRLKRRQEVYEAWRLKTFNAIRDAALVQYYEDRQKLSEKLARLQEELGAQDALSLRKKEREEVMRGVLEALGFPPEEEKYRNPKVIKFVHHAIEWENMLYFLYPYFWSDPEKEGGEYWEFKKYLDHPDPMHRVFLKSGYARVVLTIRPGFENAFLAFVEDGDMDELPPSPYFEIGKEFEAYAKTNYPGIPPANPVDNFRPLLYPKQRKAWADMQLIMQLLDRYFQANDEAYPSTEQGLAALESYTDEEIPTVPMQDPWGNDYVYTCPGTYGEYDLACYGADGEPGGEDENADITSWAEASLIGQWYEYTPTSALDIAFDEGVPSV